MAFTQLPFQRLSLNNAALIVVSAQFNDVFAGICGISFTAFAPFFKFAQTGPNGLADVQGVTCVDASNLVGGDRLRICRKSC
jgi:hypothetical protein